MIRKHLITCSVICVFVFISVLAVKSSTVTQPVVKTTVKIANVPLPPKIIFTESIAANDFSFADESLPVNDELVDKKMKHTLLLHDYKKIQTNLLQQKAQKLFPIIEPILKAFHIPDDFKYIPLVESGLSSGVSSKGAAGLWQFMPGTARTYGLKVNGNVDERMNVRKSTIAACKYIRGLHAEFNSWTLAAAAYNNGEIKLQHQINKQSEDNYFRMHLNHETGAYVYNLIAMKEIICKPVNYGFKPIYAHVPSTQLMAYN
jgi:membrane-bound lytic murein transglycosylase D